MVCQSQLLIIDVGKLLDQPKINQRHKRKGREKHKHKCLFVLAAIITSKYINFVK